MITGRDWAISIDGTSVAHGGGWVVYAGGETKGGCITRYVDLVYFMRYWNVGMTLKLEVIIFLEGYMMRVGIATMLATQILHQRVDGWGCLDMARSRLQGSQPHNPQFTTNRKKQKSQRTSSRTTHGPDSDREHARDYLEKWVNYKKPCTAAPYLHAVALLGHRCYWSIDSLLTLGMTGEWTELSGRVHARLPESVCMTFRPWQSWKAHADGCQFHTRPRYTRGRLCLCLAGT